MLIRVKSGAYINPDRVASVVVINRGSYTLVKAWFDDGPEESATTLGEFDTEDEAHGYIRDLFA